MTSTGEREISAVSWRLLGNPGELARTTQYMYFIKLSEQLAKKLIGGHTKEKFLSTNTFRV